MASFILLLEQVNEPIYEIKILKLVNVNEKNSFESVKEYQKLLMMAHLLCATSNISLTLKYPKTCPDIPKIDMG